MRRLEGADYALADGQVHVWLLDLKTPIDPGARARYVNVLDAGERARLGHLAFENLRDEYLVAHGLTRQILSRYEDVPAGALALVRNAYGRPELSASRSGLRFNLSHTTGLAALAVTRSVDIGVDLERENRRVETMEIASHSFAPAETDWLRRQPVDRQPRAFLELWTIKEAYIKARGLGLSLPLDQFVIDLANQEMPGIARLDGGDTPAEWHLAVSYPIESYVLGLAVRLAAGGRCETIVVDAAASLAALAVA